MEQDSGERFDCDILNFDIDDDAAVVELLVGDLHCPLCGCHYDPAETRMIRERAGVVTLAVQCHCCGTGSLAMVERGPTAPVSELTSVERAFFAYLPALDDADVLRVRALLRTYRGDLRDLL
jgi:hypothetical protein